MHWLTITFVLLLLAGTVLRLWLTTRQIRAVTGGRGRVPQPFDERISLEDHQKAADYTVASSREGMVETVYDVVLLLAWTLGGGLAWLSGLWDGAGLGPVLTGTAFILSAFLAMSALSLPFTILRTFGIEARFGFNRTTPALFAADQVKGLVLLLILGTPLIMLILWFMEAAGPLWWIYAWAAWVAFSLALFWAYPAFIAPMFNKFSPLADTSLVARIEQLLERCGFRSQGVFVMDGSRRSSHGNAYFTGVGNNKRIVFFDTLVDSLEPGEIEAVLAHELGHFRRKHITKRMLVTFTMSLVGLAVLGWLKGEAWFYGAFGASVASDAMALMLFLLVTPVFTFPLTPLGSYFSRRHEFEADEYAAQQSDASELIHALVKLYRDNATTLTPDSVHSSFYDSHPPAPIRVARLSALSGH